MKKRAAYYIYRNLTRKTFSVKYQGKVVEHVDRILILSGDFLVNENGRQRVLREKKKYVHAFVTTTDGYVRDHGTAIADTIIFYGLDMKNMREVSYNPYTGSEFVFRDTGLPASGYNPILIEDNKVYMFV